MATDAGIVHVLRGSTSGMTRPDNQTFTQDSPGIGSDAEDYDYLGLTLNALGR